MTHTPIDVAGLVEFRQQARAEVWGVVDMLERTAQTSPHWTDERRRTVADFANTLREHFAHRATKAVDENCAADALERLATSSRALAACSEEARELFKAAVWTATLEERNPGMDEFAGGFNEGLRKAREVMFPLLDAFLAKEGK